MTTKRIWCLMAALLLTGTIFGQLYHPGEKLDYRISYKAKLFPNTEVGSVEVKTEAASDAQGAERYKVTGAGRTLPTYRWFFNLEDVYTVMIDPATLRPESFESHLVEADYTFRSHYDYDWEQLQVSTRWQSRKREEQQRVLSVTPESLDPISLFFTMRAADSESFVEGRVETLQMVLQDTIRTIHYRYLGRETRKIRNLGKFRSLKFECELGSTEGFSFTDGTIFTLWISDDRNKIPLYIESPVRVGSIQAYLVGYKGLKYPIESRIR